MDAQQLEKLRRERQTRTVLGQPVQPRQPGRREMFLAKPR